MAATLLSINHDGPILMREIGRGHEGLEWIVDPENHAAAIDTINMHGLAGMWEILPLTEEEAETLRIERDREGAAR